MTMRLMMASALFMISCSHARKNVELSPTTDVHSTYQMLKTEVDSGYENQWDVLAEDDFSKGRYYLDQAKKQIDKGRGQDKILESLGYARSYLDEAKSKAEARQMRMEGILNARESAIRAGARDSSFNKDRIKDIDDRLRKVADVNSLDPNVYSNIQKEYLDLELSAVRHAHLAPVRAKIQAAREQGAVRYTPATLNRAEVSLRNAENTIAAHRHEEAQFQPAVQKADAHADLLTQVIQKVKAGRTILPESVALKLVEQERNIAGLSESLSEVQTQAEQNTEKLEAQGQELDQARESQQINEAFARAQKQFNSTDAEVYRQGNRILIRLKDMHFPIGKADLPAESINLLSKVKTIAEELNPMQIVVEGHTDSIGSARVNEPLSFKRAEAVADYLKSGGIEEEKIQAIGLGYKKPIASNKSREGRAQNRRVDVIIVPHLAGSKTSSM